jgi:hypothetical protein
MQTVLRKKRFYFILGGLVVFFLILINLTSFTPDAPRDVVPSPTPIPEKKQQDTTTDEEPLIPTPNPAYEAKIRQEPFWTLLPHWTDHYKVEYRDSADTILIHLFLPDIASNAEKNTLQVQYRDEALTWLRTNGADINSLTIRYRIYE